MKASILCVNSSFTPEATRVRKTSSSKHLNNLRNLSQFQNKKATNVNVAGPSSSIQIFSIILIPGKILFHLLSSQCPFPEFVLFLVLQSSHPHSQPQNMQKRDSSLNIHSAYIRKFVPSPTSANTVPNHIQIAGIDIPYHNLNYNFKDNSLITCIHTAEKECSIPERPAI